eukprot:TRINITY_DN1890_c0_g1_i1.p1 TRINITY_DN1890_c0_g1~~TRINITY_DN1890_c0_g1_i1.p1  ORF type:complete len:234 (-),score=74.98 TRINITY_DN1890_c0_g1_i1:98-799(-)
MYLSTDPYGPCCSLIAPLTVVRANTPTPFTIQTRTIAGDALDTDCTAYGLVISPQSDTVTSSPLVYIGKGRYQTMFLSLAAGSFQLSFISLAGTNGVTGLTYDSPFAVAVVESEAGVAEDVEIGGSAVEEASKIAISMTDFFQVDGLGIFGQTKINSPTFFNIKPKSDEFDQTQISIELRSPNLDLVPTSLINTCGDGTQTYLFTPNLTGKWTLSIQYDGEEIAASPYTITFV